MSLPAHPSHKSIGDPRTLVNKCRLPQWHAEHFIGTNFQRLLLSEIHPLVDAHYQLPAQLEKLEDEKFGGLAHA